MVMSRAGDGLASTIGRHIRVARIDQPVMKQT
jgi:hypothetical protein